MRLLASLIRRAIMGRYRGTALGVLWSLVTPLFMLSVYTVVFGTIFTPKWTESADAAPVAEFAVILFAGLIVFQLFSEVITTAPGLILANQNYVKKIVFPLELLVPVTLGSALFHASVSFAVLLAFIAATHGGLPWTAVLLPVVLAPLCATLLGLGWVLASLGTYVRDIGQVLNPLVTALMFLSPIFFPPSALPLGLQPYLFLNPVAMPVTQVRDVVIFGRLPETAPLIVYTMMSVAVAAAGFLWFQKTRKGFADVL